MRRLTICILLMFCVPAARCAGDIKVALASKSDVKRAAVLRAFEEAFPEECIEIVSYATKSQVPEQPIGHEMGLMGARNRLVGIPAQIADFSVSVENYIYEDDGWKDRAVIILVDHGVDEEEILYTRSTEIPKKMALKALNEKLTVGAVMHKEYPQLAPEDWHKAFGEASREELIHSALFKILHADKLQMLRAKIAIHENFPKPGIIFQDFSPICGL